MADFNNGNKSNNSVNTRGYRWYNASSKTAPATMALDFWNQFLSLSISPAKPEGDRTETSVYDYDKAVKALISGETAFLMSKALRHIVDVSLPKNEAYEIGFPIGKTSMITVNSGVGLDRLPYISIMKELDESMTPKIEEQFEFPSSKTVVKDTNGEYMIPNNVADTVEYCAILLEEFAKAIGFAQSHTKRYMDGFKHSNFSSNKKDSPFDKMYQKPKTEQPKVDVLTDLNEFAF